MPPVIEARVNDYLLNLAKPKHPILLEMEALAREKKFPIVGPECGRVLHQTAVMTGAKRVFEMGSGYGYSTLWFALAIPSEGRIFHTDGDVKNTEMAQDFLKRAGQENKVAFKTGIAQDTLKRTPGEFDVIFIDVDKEQYPECYDLARTRVRVGGAILIHNTLWSGRVADPENKDATTEGIREYLRLMWNDESFVSSFLPMHDGLGMSVRVK